MQLINLNVPNIFYSDIKRQYNYNQLTNINIYIQNNFSEYVHKDLLRASIIL